jgi:hypothetical protein
MKSKATSPNLWDSVGVVRRGSIKKRIFFVWNLILLSLRAQVRTPEAGWSGEKATTTMPTWAAAVVLRGSGGRA